MLAKDDVQGGTDLISVPVISTGETGLQLDGGMVVVASGGVLSSASIYDGGEDIVVSGGIASGTILGSYSTEIVSSGGVASGSVISSGGEEDLCSGGIGSDTVISSGGSEAVFDGGIASGTVINSGGIETVSAGGVIAGVTTIVAGGILDLRGVSGVQSLVLSSGTLTLEDGQANVLSSFSVAGDDQNLVFKDDGQGGTELVAPIVISTVTSGVNAVNGGLAIVTSGGVMISANVAFSGEDIVSSGGIASGTQVQANGIEVLSSGGIARGSVIEGASQTVSAGGVASGTVLLSGGTESVALGGIISGVTFSGGELDLQGVSGVQKTVLSGGVLKLENSAGATLAAFSVSGDNQLFLTLNDGNGGTEVMAPSFVVSTTTNGLSTSGFVEVIGHGVLNGANLYGDGMDIVMSGGIASGTSVSDAANQIIAAGGTARGTYLVEGGTEMIQSGGVASGTVVDWSGTQTVLSGGTAKNTEVDEYGYQYVSSGGTASGTQVEYNGTLEVDNGGTAKNVVLQEDGQLYDYGGTISGVVVAEGAYLQVSGGGTVTSAVVSSEGSFQVENGGSVQGVVISNGALGVVYQGGAVSNVSIATGGILDFENIGLAQSLVLSHGKVSLENSQGATLASFTVSGSTAGLVLQNGDEGGTDVVAATVIAGTTSSGVQIVSSNTDVKVANGGQLISAVVENGGGDFVVSGGSARGTVISNGGTEAVGSGGSVRGTVISNYGIETVGSGGFASGTVISGGGQDVISAGGIDSGTVISNGGEELVYAGVTAKGITVGSGGELYIGSGGTATGVILNGGATLDLGWVTATSAGVVGSNLVLTSGGTVVETIGLAGNTGNLGFAISSDGNGGTDILVGVATPNTVTATGAVIDLVPGSHAGFNTTSPSFTSGQPVDVVTALPNTATTIITSVADLSSQATITGSSGTDTLALTDAQADLSGMTLSGIEVLKVRNSGSTSFTLNQADVGPTGFLSIVGSTGKNTIVASGTSLDLTGTTLSSIEVLQAGSASTLTVTQAELTGLTSIIGSSQHSDTLVVTGPSVNLTATTLSGIAVIEAADWGATITLNQADLLAGGSIVGNNATIATGGSLDLSHTTLSGIDVVQSTSTGRATLTASATGNQTLIGGTGTNTLIGVGGDTTFSTANATARTVTTITAGSGNDTFQLEGQGKTTIDATNGGSNAYDLDTSFGTVTVNNAAYYSGSAINLDNQTDISSVSFTRSGNSLVIGFDTDASSRLTLTGEYDGSHGVATVVGPDNSWIIAQTMDQSNSWQSSIVVGDKTTSTITGSVYGGDILTDQYGNRAIVGSANGNEQMSGGTHDTITAQGGGNLLQGAGHDTMNLSTDGADVVLFKSAAQGGDTINNFTSGTDQIEVYSANFGNLANGTLASANFTTSATATSSLSGFLFNTTTHSLYYAGTATALATFTNSTITSNDIVVVNQRML